MLYLLLTILIAFITGAMTKNFPQARTRIGILALALAAVSLAIAEPTGNLAIFYLGAATGDYGVVVLLIRLVGAAFERGDSQLYRDK